MADRRWRHQAAVDMQWPLNKADDVMFNEPLAPYFQSYLGLFNENRRDNVKSEVFTAVTMKNGVL
jgi:hypothetical protein